MGRWGSVSAARVSLEFPERLLGGSSQELVLSVVNNHGDCFRPLQGCGTPSLHGHTWPICKLAYTWE